jgi:hypothetical protein
MRELKISDLSIGDWVMVDGEDWKVSAISSDSVGLCVDNDYAVAEINECDGILITPEILEKNGFVKRDTYIWNNQKMRCTAYRFGHKYWDIRVTYRARDYRPTRINIENVVYVHELQHAIRLAGIEKEIEL